jgi:putative transposase
VAKFRGIEIRQQFTAEHDWIDTRFNLDRHLTRRDIFKQNRSAALAECPQLAA